MNKGEQTRQRIRDLIPGGVLNDLTRLVLVQDAPGRAAAVAIAESVGGVVLNAAPHAPGPRTRQFRVRVAP